MGVESLSCHEKQCGATYGIGVKKGEGDVHARVGQWSNSYSRPEGRGLGGGGGGAEAGSNCSRGTIEEVERVCGGTGEG